MLVVMAVLAMASGLLALALVGALRLERVSMGTLDQFGAERELADRFRADVAGAADAPARWQEDVAGPTCLILALGADRHVVYRWDTKRLVRAESVGDTTYRHEVARALRPAAVVFERSGDGGRLLTLRLFTARNDGRQHPSAEITAALGGDLQ
jgi:hypothetical protein